MTKAELIELISEKSGTARKTVENVFDTIFDVFADQLKSGERIKITGFGIFLVKNTKSRKGVNPATGEKITIPAGKKVSFKISKNLKEQL